MKSIAAVNTRLPSIDASIDYFSGQSLQDHDIILFDPCVPYADRIDFSGGGSCLSIEGGHSVRLALKHWHEELLRALTTGKTVFVLLYEYKDDRAATGSTLSKGVRNYDTTHVANYEAVPVKFTIKNTKGQKIVVADSSYRGLYDAIKDVAHYRAVIEPLVGKKIFATRDGAAVASVINVEGLKGSLVLLPYFDLEDFDRDSEKEWSSRVLKVSHAITSQLVAIDAVLRKGNNQTPPPVWLETISRPSRIDVINSTIKRIAEDITALQIQMDAELSAKDELSEFEHLLYENGTALELGIEKALKLLGYSVQTLRIGDLEIDHVITSPEGFRMIGESEGKDSSPVDIWKFRQLESNIQEDFQRDEIDVAAKGILFGNGFRFTEPHLRETQFTPKCLTNAKRLGTALIKTDDLYRVAVHLVDHPDDDAFIKACRAAIEGTAGEIVVFPTPASALKRKRTRAKKASA